MVEGIVYLLNGIATLLWAVGICQVEIKKEKIRWLISGISFAGILITSIFFENEAEKLFFSTALIIVGYWNIVQEKVSKKIIIFLFSVFYESVIILPVNFLIEIIEILRKKPVLYEEIIQGLIETIILIIISYNLGKKEKLVKWIKNISLKYFLFGIICSVAISGITTYIEMQIKNENNKIQVIVMILTIIANLFFYGATVGLAIIDSLRERYKEENILKDEYLNLSRKHYESLLENMREVRGLKHDMKAHLNAVAYFVEKGEWTSLRSYIEDAKGIVDKNMGKFVNVNHDLVNAILTEGISGKKDIEFQYEGAIPDNIEIDDFDLCTIFSNLVSNSIEACQQVVNSKKQIILQIKRFQNSLCIYMINTVEHEMEVDELGKKTTKKDKKNHGYGVHNIIKTVEKYKGEVSFECKNNIFLVEIIFYDIIR